MKESEKIVEHTIIIGAGPCGLSSALELREHRIEPLIIEKGNIVDTIYRFPTHQTFFSTSKNLEIGNIPFVTNELRPVRNDALAYYRDVASRNNLRIQMYERVIHVKNEVDYFTVITLKGEKKHSYYAKHVIIATGYYDQPQLLHIPGENLHKVSHYFKEAHPYFQTNVAIIGGKNSAVDAALELEHAGANVTVLYRGKKYSKSIKPWILPHFDSLVQKERIRLELGAHVEEITETHVIYNVDGQQRIIENDFVFAMTGYQPDIAFLKESGINVDDKTGRPMIHSETFETNIPNMFIAGVVISGYNGNETFIENGRFHGKAIADTIAKRKTKLE